MHVLLIAASVHSQCPCLSYVNVFKLINSCCRSPIAISNVCVYGFVMYRLMKGLLCTLMLSLTNQPYVCRI